MAPSNKRRKTTALADSDDESPKPRQQNTLANYLFSSPNSNGSPSRAPTASPSPVKARSRPPTTQSSRNRSATASPEKKKSAGQRGKDQEKGKSGNILTLFSRQAQSAAAARTAKPTTPIILDDDIVSDPIDDDDDDIVADKKASSSSFVGQNARKRARDGSQAIAASTVSSSSKFLRPPRPAAPTASLDDDLRPWSERFGPTNLEELSVHKRKVADVRKWLEDVLGGRLRQRLLLLKGAAGSGKTTTMRLLARDLGCELLEWRNPAGSMNANMGYSSASAQFQEFMGRGGKFGQLDVDLTTSEPSSTASSQQQSPNVKRIILIEEFPNTFARSSTALTSFRNTILGYLASNTPSLANFGRQSSSQSITPVVMIISETLLTTTSASADSFTAHRLLGPEILRHPGARVIEFNAIAPSILAKALELVVAKEARKSGRKRTPGPLVLKKLGEIGDIRSAVSALEFLCLKGDLDADWGAKVMFTKQTRNAKNAIGLTKSETESLEMVSQREASLGIFHAVGKVVYNKRDDLPAGYVSEEVPDHLARFVRPQQSQVSVDSLMDETGTDVHTFVSALHENYALSCQSWNPNSWSLSAMDHLNGCIEYLSESDLMSPSWDIFFGGKGYTGKDSGSHLLRQDEMAYQVAVRGLLFSLPSPVHRKAPAGGKATDAFKMFYPTSIKLWRTKEELEGLVDHWSTSLLKGEESAPRKDLTQGAAAFRRAKPVNNDNWLAARRAKSTPNSTQQQEGEDTGAAPLLSLGSAARREMLLDRLPYMAQIARGRRGAFHSMKARDIEKVVSFTGIGGQQTGDESGDEALGDDAVPLTGEAWATDKPSEDSSPRKKAARIRTRSDGSVAGLAVQGLVLSDDDIED
ncbi:Rad17 cell cycle checkpoint protein [Plectosphaerella cucumerina]|uniref:Rad17 cell cycle checkpoint protein n=1 Tax=Plectosphaerella cucumerina TaxID=40658 RepID=A0A8K0TCC6_9PEZI|nr:Rad17 cell cycle checkpoint protein [Plectosphaerella cucumerina]